MSSKVDEKQVKENLDRKIPELTEEALESVSGGAAPNETKANSGANTCCW